MPDLYAEADSKEMQASSIALEPTQLPFRRTTSLDFLEGEKKGGRREGGEWGLRQSGWTEMERASVVNK